MFSATILRPLTSARNYATIADRKRQNSRGTWNGNKTNERKQCAAAKAAAGPQAVQRGRLRAAALSRRRKLRFSAACQSNPPVLLRYASSSQKIFALQIFFGSPVLFGFPCCSGCLFVACAWLRRREAPPHLSMPSTRHGAKGYFNFDLEISLFLFNSKLISIVGCAIIIEIELHEVEIHGI